GFCIVKPRSAQRPHFPIYDWSVPCGYLPCRYETDLDMDTGEYGICPCAAGWHADLGHRLAARDPCGRRELALANNHSDLVHSHPRGRRIGLPARRRTLSATGSWTTARQLQLPERVNGVPDSRGSGRRVRLLRTYVGAIRFLDYYSPAVGSIPWQRRFGLC